jgi:hypothetical protein
VFRADRAVEEVDDEDVPESVPAVPELCARAVYCVLLCSAAW